MAAVAVVPMSLPENSLVVTVGSYVSFMLPFITGPGIRFTGVSRWAAGADPYYMDNWNEVIGVNPSRLGAEVLVLLRSHQGPVFVLLEDPDPSSEGVDYLGLDQNVVRAFGITFDRASCQRVPNNLTNLGYLCRSR
jgi:hypothetical protein